MNKEELEKYAKEYTKNLEFVFETDIVQRIVRERVRLALIDVLESSVDIEKKNKNLKGQVVAGDVLEDEMAKKIKEFEQELNYQKQARSIAENAVVDLTRKNAELKAKNKWYSEQVCNKECAEVFGNLDKAKEIIKKLKALYLYPVVTKDDVKRKDEILAEAEQFLKEVSE